MPAAPLPLIRGPEAPPRAPCAPGPSQFGHYALILAVAVVLLGCSPNVRAQPMPTPLLQPTPDMTMDAVIRGLVTVVAPTTTRQPATPLPRTQAPAPRAPTATATWTPAPSVTATRPTIEPTHAPSASADKPAPRPQLTTPTPNPALAGRTPTRPAAAPTSAVPTPTP